MTVHEQLDLPGLTKAKLRSERIRVLCMMGLFAAFVLLGVFRIIVPWKDAASMGWIVFVLSGAFVGVEAWMFRTVSVCLGTGQNWIAVLSGCLRFWNACTRSARCLC